MEDRAPNHRSGAVANFHDTHSIETMTHPTQLSDMSPIKYVWNFPKTQASQIGRIMGSVGGLGGALL